jgi:hypothetical protein
MSTKIYNGYRLSPAVDLFEFTGQLRAVMNPIRTRLDAKMLMDRAITAVDTADARGEARPQAALFTALTGFDDEQRTMDPDQRVHDPHRFEVSFGRDQLTGRILCLLYADQREFTDTWESLPEVEPYGYWDNADQPQGVADAEWEQRREAWKRVMPGCTPPVECMLSFSLRSAPPYGTGMVELIVSGSDKTTEAGRMALLRSVAKPKRARARNLAVSLLAQEAIRRAKEAAGPGGKPDTMRIVSRFLLTTPADRDNYEPVVDACEAALNDDVIGFIIGDDESQGDACPLDLTAVSATVTEHLNKASR